MNQEGRNEIRRNFKQQVKHIILYSDLLQALWILIKCHLNIRMHCTTWGLEGEAGCMMETASDDASWIENIENVQIFASWLCFGDFEMLIYTTN